MRRAQAASTEPHSRIKLRQRQSRSSTAESASSQQESEDRTPNPSMSSAGHKDTVGTSYQRYFERRDDGVVPSNATGTAAAASSATNASGNKASLAFIMNHNSLQSPQLTASRPTELETRPFATMPASSSNNEVTMWRKTSPRIAEQMKTN